MIHGNCKAIWQKAAVTKAVEKGGVKALNKAAAYMRGVARRKVKRRKHKSSPPGSPPYAHSGVFKAAILHAVDPMNIASYVGPQRLVTHRTNYAGQPVPEILEFGGMAALGMNQNWIHKKAPRGVNSKSSIASYFKSIGTGPIAWGNSPAQADARGKTAKTRRRGGGRSRKSGVHPKRYSPVLRKKVYLAYIPIRTDRQAAKVAETVVEVFGYPVTNRPVRIAPRPLMGPTLADSKSHIAKYFQKLTSQ